MGVRVNRLTITAIALIVFASGAARADEPRPQIAAVGDTSAAAGPFYMRAAGSYQSIDLPSVDLGQKLLILIGPGGGLGNANGGPIATFKPVASGYGLDGGFGYFLPPGVVPPAFGARPRVELFASYIRATDTQSNATTLAPNDESFQHVNGVLSFFGFCVLPETCPTTTTLKSKYEAWHVGAKAASDFAMGPVTLTPSLALLGGEARNEQELYQSIFFVTVPGAERSLFETASEKATDRVGSRVGLNGKYDVTPWLALGLGGNVGLAYRNIRLHAYDNSSSSGSKDTFTAGKNLIDFTAGAEASVVARAGANVSFKLFGGFTYDNNVPGITAQNYTGVLFNNNPVTPVGIKTEGEIGYFAGLAMTIKFGQ
jgi:hypothetical protein